MPGGLKLRRHTAHRPCRQRVYRQSVEYLETRRLLDAVPMLPEPAAIVFSAPSHAANVHQVAGGTEPAPVEVVFIAEPRSQLAENLFDPRLIARSPEVPAFTGELIVNVEIFKPAPANPAINAQLTSPPLPLADPHELDLSLERAVFLVPGDWQPDSVGMFARPDGISFDAHPRLAELLRAPLGEVRLLMSPADGLRSSNGALAYFDPAADAERHGTTGFAVMFGQSAEGETAAMRGRAVGDVLPVGAWAEAGDAAPFESAQHGTVSYLVAFAEAFLNASANDHSTAAQAAHGGAEEATSSLAQDVLLPRFAFDAAALTVAINDLADQAEELGAGLLEMLSPVGSGEAAAVAGMVAAGLAYRHWRGSRRDPRAEEQALLSSRFLRGHATIRVEGDSS